MAVFTLPGGMIRFYKNNINFLTEHAVDPDKRRYSDSLEAPKHFLDADHYGISPFDSIPQNWDSAVRKYSENELKNHGIVPWNIQKTYSALVAAFRRQDSSRILHLSADLGHYIADAHVPLHTSENYNGQLTNQIGIHAFWESRLPELFSKNYNFYVGKASYIENPLSEAWKIVKNTYSYKDSVLLLEAGLNESFPPDLKYTFAMRNGKVDKQYSLKYSKKYHDALNGMVERQMRSSISDIGNFWYSAWVDAGQPDLNSLKKISAAEERRQKAEQESQLTKKDIMVRSED